jgi:hypothetical protein
MRYQAFRTLVGVLSAAVLLGATAYAQEAAKGRLKIHVDPEEAYTFVDGDAYGPGQHTIKLSPGNHTILIANYGFTFEKKEVSIEPNSFSRMQVVLKPSGGPVSGPRGRIQIEVGDLDAGDDAVLLNGQTPNYFVGHVDEFNNELIVKQELIVPPGTHLVTVTRHGKTIWSGNLTVGENKRVIVDISNGKQRVKDWPRGTKLGAIPRFKAGIASATVAIAPVSGNIAANPSMIDCGQTARLMWNSQETIDADISGMSPVPVSGERAVSPKQTTTYEFSATGPGGTTKSNATVQVNPVVESSFKASPEEVRYRRIGDKVMEQGKSTLSWTTSNTDAVSLDLGPVNANGTQVVSPVPAQTTYGPVNENVSYTLKASNGCGGSALKTVAVHLTGAIEPIPGVALHSVFYPTKYPLKDKPELGLLDSQRQALKTLAAGFIKYLEYDPDAKLNLVAHTDPRGSAKLNMELAERRVALAKEFLVSQGIVADKITTSAVGVEQPLAREEVGRLESQNPEPAPAARARDAAVMQLAYERRVDITLLPTKAESKRFYPNAAPDSDVLWQKAAPPLRVIEKEK